MYNIKNYSSPCFMLLITTSHEQDESWISHSFFGLQATLFSLWLPAGNSRGCSSINSFAQINCSFHMYLVFSLLGHKRYITFRVLTFEMWPLTLVFWSGCLTFACSFPTALCLIMNKAASKSFSEPCFHSHCKFCHAHHLGSGYLPSSDLF